MKYSGLSLGLILLVAQAAQANSVQVTISCDIPVLREDGSALTGPVTIQYYKDGIELASNEACSYSYTEVSKELADYQVMATDERGLVSAMSESVIVSFSPPAKPSKLKVFLKRLLNLLIP